MPEFRGVVYRTYYTNLATTAESENEARVKLRDLAEQLKPEDYDYAEPLHLLVSPLKRNEPVAAENVVDHYYRTLLDVIKESDDQNEGQELFEAPALLFWRADSPGLTPG